MSTSKLIETINSELSSNKTSKSDFSNLNSNISSTPINIESNILLSEKLNEIELNLNEIEVVVKNKLNEIIDNKALSEKCDKIKIITTNKLDKTIDSELLYEEFDDLDIDTHYKYNSKYSYDEVSQNDDPADLVDIFPNLLGNENRYYPKFWY